MSKTTVADILDKSLKISVYGSQGKVGDAIVEAKLKANAQALKDLQSLLEKELIGENELNKHPEVVGSSTAAKLWTRDCLREEQRDRIKNIMEVSDDQH